AAVVPRQHHVADHAEHDHADEGEAQAQDHGRRHAFLGAGGFAFFLVSLTLARLALGRGFLALGARLLFIQLVFFLGRFLNYEAILALGAVDLLADQLRVPNRDHGLTAWALLFETACRGSHT